MTVEHRRRGRMARPRRALLAGGLLWTMFLWTMLLVPIPILGQPEAALGPPGDAATFLVKSSAFPCLNVRQHPSTGALVVDCIAPGTPVRKLHSIDGWLKVRLESNAQGWVAATFLTEGKAAASPRVRPSRQSSVERILPVTPPSPQSRSLVLPTEPVADSGSVPLEDVKVASTVSPCLNLRHRPGTGSQTVDCLLPGTVLTAVRSIPGWKNVLTPDGLQGWVADAYVRPPAPSRSSPAGSLSARPIAGPPVSAPARAPVVASATHPGEVALLEELEALRESHQVLETSARDLRGNLQQMQAELARSQLARAELEERLQGVASKDGEAENLRRELIKTRAARDEAEDAAEVWRRQAERSTTAETEQEEHQDALQEELAAARRAQDEAQSELKAVRGALADAKAELAAARAEQAALRQELEAKTSAAAHQIATLKQRTESLEEELRQAREANAALPLLEVVEPLPTQEDREPAPDELADAEISADLPTIEAAVDQVLAWADAWQRQDVAAYLASYSRRFSPPEGLGRSAWEAQRRQRLEAPRSIQVTLREIQASLVAEQRARVVFEQTYRSDTFQDVVRKTLVLIREDGAWKILEEKTDEPGG